MKKTILYLLPILLIMGVKIAVSNQGKDIGPPGPNEVLVGPNAIIMPLDKMLLVRKDSNYCAMKFVKFWTGKTEKDLYARYESYYQDDKTGDFSNKNVKFITKELYRPKASWSFFGHPVAFGAKKEIQCGPVKLWWTRKGTVYFFEQYQPEGDYGFELAPTKWSNISEVNVFDPRVKWYKYDESRKDEIISVDQLH
jgi:hypothetical protein